MDRPRVKPGVACARHSAAVLLVSTELQVTALHHGADVLLAELTRTLQVRGHAAVAHHRVTLLIARLASRLCAKEDVAVAFHGRLVGVGLGATDHSGCVLLGQLLVTGEGYVSHAAFILIEGVLERGVPAAPGAMVVLTHVGMRIAAAVCGAVMLMRRLVVVAARFRHGATLLVSQRPKMGLAHLIDIAVEGVLSAELLAV